MGIVIRGLAGLLLALVSLAVTSARTQTVKRIEIPSEVFYYQPAASVFGLEAAWVNPAGLARFEAPGFQLMADYYSGDYGESWGMVTGRDRLAVAYREIHNRMGANFKEHVFAGGVILGEKAEFGVSYRYFKQGPGLYNNRHFWNIGFMNRMRGPISLAAVFSNLNRGKVNGERTETEQRYSVAYRPAGPRLTLSADMFLSTKTRLSNADYVYHVEFIPTPGLFVNGYIDSDRNFQVGLRANLLKYFVGHKSHFDKNGHGGRTTAFVGVTSLRQPSLIPERRRRLALSVGGRVAENPPQPVFGRKRVPFVKLITVVHRAAEDPSISEIVLTLGRLSLGFGRAQELREALACFKEHGKRIVCHLDSPDNLSYYVATVADEILIPPVSQLQLVGLRAELTFYAGTLEKLGVKIDLIRIGEYKTAAEKYTRTAASEENRQQINRILDDLYDQFVIAIADGRHIPVGSVRTIVDNGPYTSAEALESGLVDGLSYRDRLTKDYLRPMPEISFRRYLADTLLNDGWPPSPVLALVVADGEITSGSGDISPLGIPGDVTPGKMRRAFEQARLNPDVRGTVLRINSPGGSALASDEIYHQAHVLSQEKPLVVSMGNVAASGGYYIGMPAQRVFADPATITGSIGIYGGKADFSEFYRKIELGKELYTRGRHAGMLSSIRPFSDDERIKHRSHLKAFYDHFVQLVADNRSLSTDSVDTLGHGKIWTGREALANGLVDELGGVKRSLDFAAERLRLEDYRIAIYPEKKPLFILPGRGFLMWMTRLFSSGRPVESLLTGDFGMSGDEYLLTRMPFDIEIE